MEHRNDRQQRLAGSGRDPAGKGHAVRVEHRRPVAVDDALGVPRRPGRVADARGRVLVEARPVVAAVLRREQVLVAERSRHLALGHVRAVRHHDQVAHRVELVPDRLHERQEGEVHEERAVLGVVEHVDELRRVQPRIHGVDDGTQAGDAVVELEVPVGVPRDRRDRVAFPQRQGLERLRELLRPAARVGPRVAADRAFDAARDDLDRAEDRGRVLEQRGDQERPVHHQPAHETSCRLCRRQPARSTSVYFAGPNERSKSAAIAWRPSSLRFRVPVAANGRSGIVGVSAAQWPSFQVNQPWRAWS